MLSPTLSRASGPSSSSIPTADPIIPAAPIKEDLTSCSGYNGSQGQIMDEKHAAEYLTNEDRTPSSTLPAGCAWGPTIDSSSRSLLNLRLEDDVINPTSGISIQGEEGERDRQWPYRIIWVDFPPGSPQNPFFFSRKRKIAITVAATFFTLLTSMNVGAYSISMESMSRDLGCTTIQASVALGIYNFGFAITPLALAPLSEEFGRRWTYLIAVVFYLLMHIMMALAKNLPTVMLARLLQGCSGSVAATLVGGTIADIFVPADRGIPSAMFSFTAIAGSGLGPVMFCWVESDSRLEWRWVWWIQSIMIAVFIPVISLILRETREPIILRRRAKKLRKERGLSDGGRYTARSEVGKVNFWVAMRTSLVRPITFLIFEPILSFFSVWMGIGWGVIYTMLAGLRYIFSRVYGFDTNQIGLIYISIVLGSAIGFGFNFLQDAMYRRKVDQKGIEARLYGSMVAGLTFAAGCYIFGLTASPNVHWIVPCIGIVIIIASVFTIYISAFVYISECYGSYASSAVAAQSFLRNCFGGAFSYFTLDMYDALTPRWTTFTWGCVALLLSAVPFVAYRYGPQIRARSKYSKILMQEEQERIAREKQVLDGLG
ncbi:drug transporter [Kwoniella heveanensis BCC8398]|uniref:Drug transporter n=1 Tax=Kwoniella heveanensis BCC8398 TaxID=1296120 RepID=A0A1B9GNJ3_9TREE|nr:drug transporter [Kwoniella heveanensis BCC8398]